MSKTKWLNIERKDVIKAIEIFLEENPEYPNPKSTFLIYKDKKLPAKHIRGIAYKVVNGQEISKSDFAGGMETVRFFERLGFEMFYTGTSKHMTSKEGIKEKKVNPKIEKKVVNYNNNLLNQKIKIPIKGVIQQKNALQLLLNKMFNGDVVCEKTFPWLKTPEIIEDVYEDLYKSIYQYRGDKTFAKKNIQLRCDFVCESKKIIIEYDERQHFSEARKMSLLSYPNIPVCFNKKNWIQACNDINAKDRQPINRDEVRAYYDSVRDIEASKNGYRLIRIMHGQIDFESMEAKKELSKLLTEKKEVMKEINIDRNLKIGLYLQTDEVKNQVDFEKTIEIVKKTDFDVLVLPEFSYCHFESLLINSDICSEKDISNIVKTSLEFSEEIGKAVIISSMDKYGTIFSVFVNAFARENETRRAFYIKHTMTTYSAFELEDYRELSNTIFEPILFKGYRVGMTICYDCNHSVFSRMYGLKDVDIIINSTGGNVVYDKWYKYNKVRAIENNSYNFITMGGDGKGSNPNSYVFGFNRNGKEIKPNNIIAKNGNKSVLGGIYVYDISLDDGGIVEDRSHNQLKTINKKYQLEITVGDIDKMLNKSSRVADKIYSYKVSGMSIVFCIVEENDIFKPEKVLALLYAKELDKINNKRYIIVNKHKYIDEKVFKCKLSVVSKVRAMENYCAVIIESENINECYQCGKNRTAQVLQEENRKFMIDLDRTTGPEAIWKNKVGMKAAWRENFEWLIQEMNKKI